MDHPVADQRADDVSERVVAAAIRILEAGGIGRFDTPTIARRAGVAATVVEAGWPDRSLLLIAAWTAGLGWRKLVEDTGTLRGDLLVFGEALLHAVQTPEGRMLFRSSLPIDGADEFDTVRRQFWSTQFDTVTEIIRRAAVRGELRRGIDPFDAMRMFCTALYFDALYLDSDTDAAYLASVVDIFLRGIADNPTADFAETDRTVRAIVGASQQDPMQQDRLTPDYVHATSAQIRQAILDATIRETALRGPELLTRNTIAKRVGVPIHVVERIWKTDADLLTDAGTRAREVTRPLPDTGSLGGDVLSFTDAKAQLISTPAARRRYLSAIVRTSASRNAHPLMEFWLAGLKESTQICLRAQERGELRAGVNPGHATRVAVASLYYDLFFADAAMRPDYASAVLDIFLNGAGR